VRNEGSDEHFEEDISVNNGDLHPPRLCSPKLTTVLLLALQAGHQGIQFLLDYAHLRLTAMLLHPVATIADKALKQLKKPREFRQMRTSGPLLAGIG
jgi:hypothetical protein